MRTSPLSIAILAAVFLITFNSCKKKDPEIEDCQVTSIRDDAGDIYIAYEYDNEGRIIKQTDAGNESYYTYDYSQANVQMDSYESGVHSIHSTTAKNSQGKIIMRLDHPQPDLTGVPTDTIFYNYDANGHLIRTDVYPNSIPGYNMSFGFSYIGDDVQSITYYMDLDTFTVHYTYTALEARNTFLPLMDVGTIANPPGVISLSKHLPATVEGMAIRYKIPASGYVLQAVAVDPTFTQDTLMNVTFGYTCK